MENKTKKTNKKTKRRKRIRGNREKEKFFYKLEVNMNKGIHTCKKQSKTKGTRKLWQNKSANKNKNKNNDGTNYMKGYASVTLTASNGRPKKWSLSLLTSAP